MKANARSRPEAKALRKYAGQEEENQIKIRNAQQIKRQGKNDGQKEVKERYTNELRSKNYEMI